MKDDPSIRAARAEMEQAKVQSEKTFSGKPREPRRNKVYDRIAQHVSLRTVDAVIIVVAVAIVALLVVGILTGKPQQ